MPEKMWLLKNCDLFQRLAPEELQHLESSCRVRTFPRGGLIYVPRDLGDGVLLLSAGRVKLCTITAEGKQPILAFIEPGELFGELAVLETGNRDEYAEACEPSTVILIPADSLRQLMERHAHLSIGITRLMGLRRRRVERRLKSLLFCSNRERLVGLLLELSEQYGSPVANGVEIGIKLSHQDLANIIGATRESVTIVLGELQSEGMVETGRRRIVLKDLARLAQDIHAQPPKLAAETCPSDQTHAAKTDPCARANL